MHYSASSRGCRKNFLGATDLKPSPSPLDPPHTLAPQHMVVMHAKLALGSTLLGPEGRSCPAWRRSAQCLWRKVAGRPDKAGYAHPAAPKTADNQPFLACAGLNRSNGGSGAAGRGGYLAVCSVSTDAGYSSSAGWPAALLSMLGWSEACLLESLA